MDYCSRVQVFDHDGCDRRSRRLEDHVGEDVFGFGAAAHPDSQGDGRIVMAARDVASGKDHHHQDRANRERRNDATAAGNYRHTDGEDKKECSDKLHHVFFHGPSYDSASVFTCWLMDALVSWIGPEPSQISYRTITRSKVIDGHLRGRKAASRAYRNHILNHCSYRAGYLCNDISC